jgi:hypothetical protein
MEGLASGLLEVVLCTDFSKESMPKSSIRQRSLHTPFWPLMFQLPPLQRPCKVKDTSDEGIPPEDRLKRRYALEGECASIGLIGPSICTQFFHFLKERKWLSKAPDGKVLMKRWSLWLT